MLNFLHLFKQLCKIQIIIFQKPVTENLKYNIALTLLPNVGDILAKRLVAYCGSAQAIFKEKKS